MGNLRIGLQPSGVDSGIFYWGTDFSVIVGSPNGRQLSLITSRLREPAITLLVTTSDAERNTIFSGLADLPPKPPRSKLEPHRELIRELRRKGRTYREIARLFEERLGLCVVPSTLHSFVKVRVNAWTIQ